MVFLIIIRFRNVKNDEVKQFIEDKKSKAEFKDLVTKFARIDTEGSVYDNMGPEKFDEVFKNFFLAIFKSESNLPKYLIFAESELILLIARVNSFE